MEGTRIGRYKLLEKLGEGGCGVVFVAQQYEPVQRRVALKVIKPGMDTKGVLARFDMERQALAMMDHPNISKVFDAGSTETGRPYFVMELVLGSRITDFCDQNRLTIAERVSLFHPTDGYSPRPTFKNVSPSSMWPFASDYTSWDSSIARCRWYSLATALR